MQTTKQLVDRAKKARGIESDYRLAKELGITSQAVTNWRNGRSGPDDATAARLAELAGQNPESVIAELHAERAKTPEVRALWLRMAQHLRHAVAAVMFTMGAAMLLLAGSPTSAEASTGGSVQSQSGSLCIMLNRARRVRRSIARGIRFAFSRGWQSFVLGVSKGFLRSQNLWDNENRDDPRAPAFSRAAFPAGA